MHVAILLAAVTNIGFSNFFICTAVLRCNKYNPAENSHKKKQPLCRGVILLKQPSLLVSFQ